MPGGGHCELNSANPAGLGPLGVPERQEVEALADASARRGMSTASLLNRLTQDHDLDADGSMTIHRRLHFREEYPTD